MENGSRQGAEERQHASRAQTRNDPPADTDGVLHFGYVCTFNFDTKFGFINRIAPTMDGAHVFVEQVFVHVKDLRPTTRVPAAQFKLITGELVQFYLAPPRLGSRCPQARCVRGAFGVPLMCEHGDIQFMSYSGNVNYPPELRRPREQRRPERTESGISCVVTEAEPVDDGDCADALEDGGDEAGVEVGENEESHSLGSDVCMANPRKWGDDDSDDEFAFDD